MTSLTIQEAIYYELNKVDKLTKKVNGIFDDVLQTAKYPYITIGDDTAVAWDTDSAKGVIATCSVHIWSRYKGRKEVKELMDIIYDALHQKKINALGIHITSCLFEFSTTFTEPDGLTRRGVIRFRVKAHEEVS